MRILYLVSTTGNPLYRGRYALHGKYMTFGQQSFMLDLVTGLAKRGETVILGVDGLESFALTNRFRRYATVVEPSDVSKDEEFDLVLLDEGSDDLLDCCPDNVPLFRIVHNAATPFSARLQKRCDRWICLTERSFALLSERIALERLLLSHQGVDLDRFRSRPATVRPAASPPHVLIYSRLDTERAPAIWPVLEALESSNLDITVLGDGDLFWPISDRFGDRITLIHFIPCTSMQNFLPGFDVAISSARGVMEALAMGIPALCAGEEYAGLVRPENIRQHLTVNITGYGMGVDPGNVVDDLEGALEISPSVCRAMADEQCSVQRFIDRILAAYAVLPGGLAQITN